MDTLIKCLSELNIEISNDQIELFDRYYEFLIFWNNKFNLTSITDKEDVIVKHFVDSTALLKYVDLSGCTLLDVGSGAGFPGIPLKIMCNSCSVVLLDSLNKRVGFLNEVIKDLGLSGIRAVHGRAEDIARDQSYREKFDFVTSRAVASLSILSEYCLPFVRIGGHFISYKSGDVDTELNYSSHAISILGGKIGNVHRFCIPGTEYERSFICTEKLNRTPDSYPRKAGMPSKKPL